MRMRKYLLSLLRLLSFLAESWLASSLLTHLGGLLTSYSLPGFLNTCKKLQALPFGHLDIPQIAVLHDFIPVNSQLICRPANHRPFNFLSALKYKDKNNYLSIKYQKIIWSSKEKQFNFILPGCVSFRIIFDVEISAKMKFGIAAVLQGLDFTKTFKLGDYVLVKFFKVLSHFRVVVFETCVSVVWVLL